MAKFPKIQSPCPAKDRLSEVMDGDFCRICQETVIDITDMTDEQRVALVNGRQGKMCVTYRRPAIAAAAVAAAMLATPMAAAAQDAPATEAVSDNEVGGLVEIIVGGIKSNKPVEFVDLGEEEADKAIPELPVAYEDEEAPATDEPTPVKAAP